MDQKLAVDVVLLPDQEDIRRIIGLIEYEANSELALNEIDFLPHISLAMGVMSQNDLSSAKRIIDEITDEFCRVECTIDGLSSPVVPNGKVICDANVVKTAPLQLLHAAVLKAFRPLLSHDTVTLDMFFDGQLTEPTSIAWAEHYYEDKPEGFRPHITLGGGTLASSGVPLTFTAKRLAICHLGTYCSCRKILVDSELTKYA